MQYPSNSWHSFFIEQQEQPYFQKLMQKVDNAYKMTTVYPPKDELFRVFDIIPKEKVKVVILGQDPYHGLHQAHGLSFSIKNIDAKFPPSLRNILQELQSDLGIERTTHDLTDWAEQGVFLLNTGLTVEEGKAGSHRSFGWQTFTEHVINTLEQQEQPIIYVLWGKDAQNYDKLITNPKHTSIQSVHPSPLSAYRGFFGSKPFSQINQFLEKNNLSPINWE